MMLRARALRITFCFVKRMANSVIFGKRVEYEWRKRCLRQLKLIFKKPKCINKNIEETAKGAVSALGLFHELDEFGEASRLQSVV